MRPRILLRSLFLSLAAIGFGTTQAWAIIVFGSTDGRNLSAPTGTLADSGWQFEGSWQVGAGTAIAPNYFLTARHLGGSVGDSFTVHGVSYTTTAAYDDPAGTDLRIWQVAQKFTSYAPLYAKSDETGTTSPLVTFGRGTARGADVSGPNGLQGYLWGGYDGALSWGTDRVSFLTTLNGGPSGNFLGFNFNSVVGQSATYSLGDSGGGLFLKDTDGVWKLAGVNYAVDGNYSLKPESDYFSAAMYDARDYYVGGPGANNHSFVSHPTPDQQLPQSAYASRVSDRLGFINGATGVPEPGSVVLTTVGLAILACLGRRRRTG